MLDLLLPYTSTFSFPLFKFLSLLFKKQFFLLWFFFYLTSSSTSLSLSPFELLDLFISPINYLTFSSTSLSLTSWTPWPLHLPINCTPNFLFKSCAEIFFSLRVVPMVLLLFESQRCVLFPLSSDWFCRVSCFYLFLYLVFLFCSIFYFLVFFV